MNSVINFEYQSGTCNIGAQEKSMRRRFGYLGIILSVLGFLSILVLDLDPIFNLGLIFPIYMSVIGIYQDKNNFCVAFGFSGVYNVDQKAGKTKKLDNVVQIKADRKKAIKMTLIALIISVFLTFSAYGISLLI